VFANVDGVRDHTYAGVFIVERRRLAMPNVRSCITSPRVAAGLDA
jgi:hypothetical protein